MTANIIDNIEAMDTVAKVAAYRSIAHSMMAKAIGAIRQDIRNSQYLVRNPEEAISTEQRNEQDAWKDNEGPAPYGLQQDRESAILQASRFHKLYEYAVIEIRTLSSSKWDEPMSPVEMLDFMIQKATPTDVAFLQALADAAGTDLATIKTFQEAQERQEREQLTEQKPEILQTFKGFSEGRKKNVEYINTPDEEIDVISQHQLAVKIVEGLGKAKNKSLERALRSRKLTELGNIPLFEEGIKLMSANVDRLEKEHRAEIGEAMEAGRNVRTLADVA
jgi:hypothetical protein